MPNLASWHPQIVHFVIALLAIGVLFRWISLTGRAAFTGPAAATLLLAGALAAVLAVHSGLDAHGLVERIPGVRAAVMEHEEWGQRTRNLFLIVAALEVAALALAGRPGVRRGLLVASAIVGLAGGGALYEAGEHGGELVYSYAGGIGIRSGDSSDVPRLLLAGIYQSALQARARHDSATAAALFGELARRWPTDTNVRLLAIQSLLQDNHDGRGALDALARFTVPADNARLVVGVGYLKADAFVAVGKPDSARVVLAALVRQFPDNLRIKDRLAKLK